MLDSEREKLINYEHKYLSIGITSDGKPKTSCFVPWKYTANAFNMRIPGITFCRDDLDDPEIKAILDKLTIHGCYIFTPLDDYSFLSRFPDLWDLHIQYGDAISSLSFMNGMNEWFQLFVENAHIPNLSDLFPSDRKPGMHSYCIAFNTCVTEDMRDLAGNGIRLSELHVWTNSGSDDDRKRWEKVSAGHFDYYIYPDKKD